MGTHCEAMMPTRYVLLFVWAALLHVDGLRVEDKDKAALANNRSSEQQKEQNGETENAASEDESDNEDESDDEETNVDEQLSEWGGSSPDPCEDKLIKKERYDCKRRVQKQAKKLNKNKQCGAINKGFDECDASADKTLNECKKNGKK